MRSNDIVHIRRDDIYALQRAEETGEGRIRIGIPGAIAWSVLAFSAGWLLGLVQTFGW